MLMDVVMTLAVLAVLAGVTSLLAASHPGKIRLWIWAALGQYLVCGAAQLYLVRSTQGDATYYMATGIELARFLDTSFVWAAQETVRLFLQQPSAFDVAVIGATTNTGSMCAMAAWLVFLLRGSEYAVQALVSGLAMFGSLAIYSAFVRASPGTSPKRIFVATVFFPSVAFWTSALHKESFCLMGIALILAGGAAAYERKLRAALYVPLGLLFVLEFRAPALPPLLFGLVIYFVVERLQRARGIEAPLFGPLYLAVGLGIGALGMLLVTRVSPDLALDRLAETVTVQQRAWSGMAGGSSFTLEDPREETLTGQLTIAPLALVNALFRPQLFDVANPMQLLSALEMTTITYMIYRSIRINGLAGVLGRIQRSPFLLLCIVVTLIGCTFIGLTTRNFGSLARYRVPFLPFYGALLAVLSEKIATAPAPEQENGEAPAAPVPKRRAVPRRGPRRAVETP